MRNSCTYFRENGFTLIELSIVLIVISSLLAVGIPVYKSRVVEPAQVKQTAKRYQMVYDASLRYRADTGSWPASTAVLTGANYLPSGADQTVWGGAIALTASGANLSISVPTPELKYALKLAPYTANGTIAGTTVSDVMVPPGTEASLSALYARDGSNGPMLADVNMNSNSLIGAVNVTASGTVSGSTLSASTDVRSPVYIDSDNPSRFVNPDGNSEIETLDLRSMRDLDDLAYSVDPNANSVLSGLDAEDFRVTDADIEGTGCSIGGIGRNAAGEIMSCVGGLWKKVGFTPTISSYVTSSSGITSLNLGSHKFCSLSQSYINKANDAGGCGVTETSGNWRLNAWSDSAVNGVSICRAMCFD